MPDTGVATKVLTTLVFIAGAFASSAVRSVDVTWVGPDGGDWNDGDNWVGRCDPEFGCFPPQEGDDVFLTTPSLAASTLVNYINPENLARFDSVLIQGGDDGEGNSIDITLDHQQDALSTGFLTVEGLAGGQGIYNLGGTGTMTVGTAGEEPLAGSVVIGLSGTGTFNQTGGAHTILGAGGAFGTLTLGQNAGSTGGYALSGGDLTTGSAIIGNAGTGTFTHSGGSHSVTDLLSLGATSSGNGSYTLSGTGSLTVGREEVGGFGTGLFTQDGGTHTVETDIFIGNGVGSTGTYELNGGSLTVGGLESVGGLGTATFSQTGGTNESGNLEVGVGGDGTYVQSDGVNTVQFNQTIGGVVTRDGQDFFGSGTYTQTGGTSAVGGTLLLGSAAGTAGTYDLSGDAILTTANTTVGGLGTGTFDQTGGTHTILGAGDAFGTLTLGTNAGSTGTYNLSGDSTLTTDRAIIGLAGTGLFNQRGGTHTANQLLTIGGEQVTDDGTLFGTGTYTQSAGITNVGSTLLLGQGAGSSGTYDLSETGNLTVGTAGEAPLAGSVVIGLGGTGTFNQTGGTHTILGAGGAFGTLTLGQNAGSTGTYDLSGDGSTLSTDQEIIGNAGTGTFTHSSGSHSVTDLLSLGTASGGNGSYTLSGTGDLTSTNTTVGGAGTGTFSQTGGTHGVSDTLVVGQADGGSGEYTQAGGTTSAGTLILGQNAGSTGAYALSGGDLTTGSAIIGNAGAGTFTHSSGTHSVTDLLSVGAANGGNGSYALSGTGDLTSTNTIVGGAGTGTFSQTGGTHGVSDTLVVGQADGGSGEYTQAGGTTSAGTLILGQNAGSAGAYALSGGDLTTGSAIIGNAGTGTFTHSSGTHNVTDLLSLGTASGGNGSYTLGGGSLTTTNTTVGGAGAGTFIQTNGTNTVGDTLLINAQGAYQLQGGSLDGASVSNDGEFIQSGGQFFGTLTNNANFTYDEGGGLFLGRLINNGSATFNADFTAGNGLENNRALAIGDGRTLTLSGLGLTNNGLITLSGTGHLVATDEIIGDSRSGTFDQSGGSNVVSNALIVGATSGTTGSYSQSGGTASAGSVVVGRDAGSVGTYTLTGGALSVAETFTVGGSGAGTLNVAGGSVSAAQLINNGSLNFSGGDINANLINTATVNVSGSGMRTFAGEVTNLGTFKVTDTTAVYTGTFNNHGAYVSDPSTNDFQDLNVGPQGYLAGGASDTFIVRGNFVNSSSQNANWKTEESNLVFAARNNPASGDPRYSPGSSYSSTVVAASDNPVSSDTTHQMGLPGEDRGPNKNGFQNNFAWGQVTLNSGERLMLSDANNVPGAALYASRFTLGDGITQLKSISGDYNIYYDPNLTENGYLAGNAFNFGAGAGQLVPQGFTFFGAPGTTLLDAASLGFTVNELSFADALNSACPSATGALADRCRELRALDDAQRQQAIASLTPTQQLSQVVAPIKLNFARMDAPLLRMAQLRSGHAQPVTFSFNGYQMPFTQLAAVLGPNARGGAAGDPESLDEPFRDKPFGVYVQGKFDHGSQSINPDSFGFNLDSRALTIGTDYRFTDALVGGVALEYNNVHTSFHNSGGSMETESLLGAIYGSYYLPEDFYVDGMATYGSNDYALTRTYHYPGFAGRSTSNPNAYQYSFSLSGGKDIAWQEWLFTPYTRFEYIQMQFDRYQERGGDGLAVNVASQSVSSAITTLGTQISYHLSMPWGILIPAIRFEWEHQFLNNNQANAMVLSAATAGTGNFNIQSGVPDRDYVNLGGSLSATLPEGGAVFLRYDTRLGQSYIANHIVEAGIKIPF